MGFLESAFSAATGGVASFGSSRDAILGHGTEDICHSLAQLKQLQINKGSVRKLSNQHAFLALPDLVQNLTIC